MIVIYMAGETSGGSPQFITQRRAWYRRAVNRTPTGRGQLRLEAMFGKLDKNELALSLGSGTSKYGPRNLVNLDALYARHTVGMGIRVAGLMQELPFRDEAFDSVRASYSFLHIKSGLPQALCEAIRVTKVGGKVSIAPILTFLPSKIRRTKDAVHNLQEGGLPIETRGLSRRRWEVINSLGGVSVAALPWLVNLPDYPSSFIKVIGDPLIGLALLGQAHKLLNPNLVLDYERTAADTFEEHRMETVESIISNIPIA